MNLERVTAIVQQRYPDATSEIVAGYCAGPWEDDPQLHEGWLRFAPDEEIAAWVEQGYPWEEK